MDHEKILDSTFGLGWICLQGNHTMLIGGCGLRRNLFLLHLELESFIWAMSSVLLNGLDCQVF